LVELVIEKNGIQSSVLYQLYRAAKVMYVCSSICIACGISGHPSTGTVVLTWGRMAWLSSP